jgi:hypothetical protein
MVPPGEFGLGEVEAAYPIPVLRQALATAQKLINKEFPSLRGSSTCSREFLDLIGRIEEAVSKELLKYGFKRVPEPAARERKDLIIGYYVFHEIVVEFGVRDLNKCAVLEELTGGKPPRVYAKILVGGQTFMVLEGFEEEGKEGAAEVRYIF